MSSSARVSGSGSLSLARGHREIHISGTGQVALLHKTKMANLVTRARWRNPSRFFLFAPEWSFYLYRSGAVGVHVYTESTVRLYKRFQLWSPQCHRGNGAVVISR